MSKIGTNLCPIRCRYVLGVGASFLCSEGVRAVCYVQEEEGRGLTTMRYDNWQDAYRELCGWLVEEKYFPATGVVVDVWLDADKLALDGVREYFFGSLPTPTSKYEKCYQILLAYVAHEHGVETTADHLAMEGMTHHNPFIAEHKGLLINAFAHTPPWLVVRKVICNRNTFESV